MMWLLSQKRKNSSAFKKKMIVGLGLVGILFIASLGFIGYLGIKTAGLLISNVPTQNQVVALTNNLQNQGGALMAASASPQCWTELQAHFGIAVWINRPIAESGARIMKACLGLGTFNSKDGSEGAKNDQIDI